MADHSWIKTARPGKCAECQEPLEAGDKALYEISSHLGRDGRKIYCEDCGNEVMANI